MRLKIIAEIGSNWNGSKEIGKKIIISTKQAGADYVKFQMWRAKDLYNQSHPNWKEINKSELQKNTAKKLKQYADEIGIDFFCSAFYPEAVDCLEDLHVKLYKVASITSAFKHKFALETLERIALTNKPVIISLGFGENKDKLKKILKNNKLYFLYCIPRYPTHIGSLNFNKMMKYDGFSDHTEGSLAPILFASISKNSKKLLFLEKHVSITESKGPDKPFSMDMESFQKMISEIRKVNRIRNTLSVN